jgi:hypothetical protein
LPTEILLPLFAVTLLANAVLVAFAIRGLRRGSGDHDDPDGRDGPRRVTPPATPAPEPPMTDQLARAIAARRAVSEPVAHAAIEAPGSARSGRSPAPLAPDPAPVSAAPAAAAPSSAPVAQAPAELPKPAPARPKAARAGESGKRGRRRFSLPPLDDDHEKVSRSIETFLGGVEPATADAASDPGTAAGATTVALVAVDGLPRPTRRSRSARVADDDATARALAMVERTIRGAARGTDVVTVVERGRFRIVLPTTGELAARAYLRRIRATVEPLLESADRPLRLAVATATVLDEPLADGVRRADRRMATALAALDSPSSSRSDGEAAAPDASAVDEERPDVEPRAAGD